MRMALWVFGALAAFAISAPAAAGDVYVIENSQGKKPIVVQGDSFALAGIPAMGEGKPNQGFSYATAFELAGTGIQIARGHIDPGGKVATHEGPQQYILYVIRGNGKLSLVGDGGQVISELAYKPDDIIVFQPHTLHGWINGSEPFDFLGVDLPTPRK